MPEQTRVFRDVAIPKAVEYFGLAVNLGCSTRVSAETLDHLREMVNDPHAEFSYSHGARVFFREWLFAPMAKIQRVNSEVLVTIYDLDRAFEADRRFDA